MASESREAALMNTAYALLKDLLQAHDWELESEDETASIGVIAGYIERYHEQGWNEVARVLRDVRSMADACSQRPNFDKNALVKTLMDYCDTELEAWAYRTPDE